MNRRFVAPLPELHVVDKVEGLYTHCFLGELGNNWSDVCTDELATYGKFLEVPQQVKNV